MKSWGVKCRGMKCRPPVFFGYNKSMLEIEAGKSYFTGWKEANSTTKTETTLEEHPLQLMMEFKESTSVIIKCDGANLVTITRTKVLFGDGTNSFSIPTDVSVVLCTIFIDKDDNLCVICESQEASFKRYNGCYKNDVPLRTMSFNPENQDNVYYRTLHSLDTKQGK